MNERITIQHVLIDLDGTLTDPKEGILRSVLYALEKLQQPLPDESTLEWVIGPPLKQSLATLLEVNVQDELAEQALLAYRERFSTLGMYENKVYPYVVETLTALKQRGFQLYVATAKPTVFARQILEHFGLASFFQGIYGSELTGERTNKGELLSYLLQQEQLDAKQCIMVGDREYDILAAKLHGMLSVAVSYGYAQTGELTKAKADYCIHHFSELLTLYELS